MDTALFMSDGECDYRFELADAFSSKEADELRRTLSPDAMRMMLIGIAASNGWYIGTVRQWAWLTDDDMID
jgi:hypothetical protein